MKLRSHIVQLEEVPQDDDSCRLKCPSAAGPGNKAFRGITQPWRCLHLNLFCFLWNFSEVLTNNFLFVLFAILAIYSLFFLEIHEAGQQCTRYICNYVWPDVGKIVNFHRLIGDTTNLCANRVQKCDALQKCRAGEYTTWVDVP